MLFCQDISLSSLLHCVFYFSGQYIEAGGSTSAFRYMAISQLVSPRLTSVFTLLPHCLEFRVLKSANSTVRLVVATYIKIGETLNNERIFWTSENVPLNAWSHIRLTVEPQTVNEYFDHIVFEVRRQYFSVDTITYGLDDISISDGVCL